MATIKEGILAWRGEAYGDGGVEKEDQVANVDALGEAHRVRCITCSRGIREFRKRGQKRFMLVRCVLHGNVLYCARILMTERGAIPRLRSCDDLRSHSRRRQAFASHMNIVLKMAKSDIYDI